MKNHINISYCNNISFQRTISVPLLIFIHSFVSHSTHYTMHPLTFDQNLSGNQRQQLLARFPNKIKLSYEMVVHKKVSSDGYDIGIAIPQGQRAYIWFTFYKQYPVCCVCELDRTNTIGEKVYFVDIPLPTDYVLGTILSGFIVQERVVTKPSSAPTSVPVSAPIPASSSRKKSSNYPPLPTFNTYGNDEDSPTEEQDVTEHLSKLTIQTNESDTESDEPPKFKTFIIDNMYSYKGIPLDSAYHPTCYHEKLPYIYDFVKTMQSASTKTKGTITSILFSLPVMWKYDRRIIEKHDVLPMDIHSIAYTVKHIQYMCSTRVVPLLNVSIHKRPIWDPTLISTGNGCHDNDNDNEDDDDDADTEKHPSSGGLWKTLSKKYVAPLVPIQNLALNRPIYRETTHFWVKPDLAHDVYYLYAKRSHPHIGEHIMYGYAFVPDMKTSLYMNAIFRHIKENRNLDYIEESDDEDEFENVQEDRFVQLNKMVLMECNFDWKFKKWVPIRIAHTRAQGFRVVPYLDQLIVRDVGTGSGNHTHGHSIQKHKQGFTHNNKHNPRNRR
jgi:hypothetical protein